MTSSPEPLERWTPTAFGDADGSAPAATLAADAAAWRPRELGGHPSAPAAGPSPLEEAHARGLEEGLRLGEERATRSFRDVAEVLAGAATAVSDAAAEFAAARERNLEALALAVARHLVQRELEADPRTLDALVRRALELVPAREPVTLRLHPADLDRAAALLPALARPGEAGALRAAPDAALSRGDFVVESPRLLVDGRVDGALRQIYDRLDHARA